MKLEINAITMFNTFRKYRIINIHVNTEIMMKSCFKF